MAGASAWAPPGPGRFRLDTGSAPTNATTELNTLATPAEGAEAEAQPWNPANPLFWVGALAAVTFGLMAFSTNVRIGHAKASVSVGSQS